MGVLRRQGEARRRIFKQVGSRFSTSSLGLETFTRRVQKPTFTSMCVLFTGVHTDNQLPQTCFTFWIPSPSNGHPAPQIRKQKTLIPPSLHSRGHQSPGVPLRTALTLSSQSPLWPSWLKSLSQLVSFLQLHSSLHAACSRAFPKPCPDSFQPSESAPTSIRSASIWPLSLSLHRTCQPGRTTQ